MLDLSVPLLDEIQKPEIMVIWQKKVDEVRPSKYDRLNSTFCCTISLTPQLKRTIPEKCVVLLSSKDMSSNNEK